MTDLYESPIASDTEEDFDIELSSNKRRILEHYKLTGEFCQKAALKSHPSAALQAIPVPMPSKVEKIEEATEEEENLQTKKSGMENTEIVCTLATPAAESSFTKDQDIRVLREKLNQQFQVREVQIKKEAQQLLMKFKCHQKFIIELIFSLELVDRLENNLDRMLARAEETFIARKETEKKKEQDKARYFKEEQDRKLKCLEEEERRLCLEEERRLRAQREQKSLKQLQLQERILKLSPKKLPRPASIKGLEFSKKLLAENTPKLTPRLMTPTKVEVVPCVSFSSQKPRTSASPMKEIQLETPMPFKLQLEQRLKLISEGRVFKRINLNTLQADNVELSCSPDFKRLVIRQAHLEPTSQAMSELVQIHVGRLSQATLRPLDVTEDYLSFSIIFMKKTLHLQSSSLRERGEFLESLQELRKMSQY